jgi:hypothetical protein
MTVARRLSEGPTLAYDKLERLLVRQAAGPVHGRMI